MKKLVLGDGESDWNTENLVAYTSVLKRDSDGALQGLNEANTAEKFGEEQVEI